MFVLRPIRESDQSGLVTLAASIGGGLTTLPSDGEFLGDRIHESLRAFHPRVRKPGGEYYLFALEDSATGELAGVSGIASRVGGFEPWYSYEIRRERFHHRPLKVDREIPVLHLKREHRGPSEMCSLFLRPERRRAGAGRLLSLGRFHFMGAFRPRFTDEVIAELRGYLDQTGRSPFWEAVGRHFFPFDFYAADVLSGLGEKDFIANLMPRHPIYLPLLGPEVEAAVGRVHHETEPARAMLLAEGFVRVEEVDIFDAGPVLRSPVAQLRTLRTLRTAIVGEINIVSAGPSLLSNGQLDFRACLGPVALREDGSAILNVECARALNISTGDPVSWSPLK